MIKFILLLFITCQAWAVHINPKQTGEVLLIPFYTVNNNLNTMVGITNTTDATKAIKVSMREGLNGFAVMSYNVYLGPYDSWTFVLGAVSGTVEGYEGDDFAAHATSDLSCAPYLNKSYQEFNPEPMFGGLLNIRRVREGFIEIIEMGELGGALGAAAVADSAGVPNDCALIESAWDEGGTWNIDSNEDLSPGSGGLMAQADIIDVAEGINYSMPVVALVDFFSTDGNIHVGPTDSHLSLDAAAPNAIVYANEKSYQLVFNSGINAVSAVLMVDELFSTYNYEATVSGQNEIIYSQPTRRFYHPSPSYASEPPYPTSRAHGCSNEQVYGGVELEQVIWDREAQRDLFQGGVGGIPQPPNDSLCGSVFVQSIVRPGSGQSESPLTKSNNFQIINGVSSNETESGFTRIRFIDTRPLVGTDINTNKIVHLMGLPMMGVSLGRFVNNNAGEGLLAQYGFAHLVKSKSRLIEQ